MSGRPVAHLLPVMLDDASGSGADHGMMARDVADHAADRRAFQTAFGGPDP